MTYAIADFSRVKCEYVSDDGNTYKVTTRTAINSGMSDGALTLDDGSHPEFPGKPRHIYMTATTIVGTGDAAYFPKKKVIFNTADYDAVVGATLTCDGLTFEHKGGVIGERKR